MILRESSRSGALHSAACKVPIDPTTNRDIRTRNRVELQSKEMAREVSVAEFAVMFEMTKL